MRRYVSLFSVLSLLLVSHLAAYAEANPLCLKNLETGKMYHAMAMDASGIQLNQAAHSPVYDPLAHFVVVSWTAKAASIIEMKEPFLSVNYMPSNGIDQDGHVWQVSIYSTSVCP